jgi:3-(3-hydroxy-phenyl)propionate hydroxylase
MGASPTHYDAGELRDAIPTEVDVLIVGYGPVGATLACRLGRDGVRTLVVDKSAQIFTAPRAILLDNEVRCAELRSR